MEKKRGARVKKCAIFVLLVAAAAGFIRTLPAITAFAAPAARLSAFFAMPEGSGALGSGDTGEEDAPSQEATSSAATSSATSTSGAQNMATSSAIKPVNPADIKGSVIETQYTGASANLSWSNIFISNKTKSHTVNIEKEIKIKPDIQMEFSGKPEVLIYHTHATEAYVEGDTGYFTKDHQARTTDTSKNVVRVGEEIAKVLEQNGIGVLHDKTLHDSPSYDAGYDNSEAAMKKYMEEYPTLKVFLDIHRDAITKENGDKMKPTVTIGGKKAAQLMIAAGCQDNGVTGFPNWMQNMRFALRLQQSLETKYPGLTRPIYFVSKKYNEYLANGSLLIEMGSEGNTLEEAIYTGELLANALADVLRDLKK